MVRHLAGGVERYADAIFEREAKGYYEGLVGGEPDGEPDEDRGFINPEHVMATIKTRRPPPPPPPTPGGNDRTAAWAKWLGHEAARLQAAPAACQY